MLLKTKFDYQNINRQSVEGKRLYSLPDGSRVPSVTTILERTKPQEKIDALNAWRNRVGHERAQQITTEAANRGTRMHKFLEDYVKQGEINQPGTNPYSKISHTMAELIIKEGLGKVDEVWGVEVPLYFPGLYAGTTDGCGLHQGDQSILDYKQTNKPKKQEWIEDYYLQLAAYALAHNEVYGTNIRKGVVLMCVKPVIDEKTFEILEPPKYQEFTLNPNEFDYWANRWWDRVDAYYSKN